MDFTVVANLESRKNADLLVLPFWKEEKEAVCASDCGKLQELVSRPLDMRDFVGKEGEVLFLYTDEKQEKRVALLGLGEEGKATTERLRRAYASLTKACHPKKIKEVNILMPKTASLSEEAVVRGISEGMLLANYTFDRYKMEAKKENPTVLIKKAALIGAGKGSLSLAKKYASICQAVYLARDLVNSNADDVTPQYLAEVAKSFSEKLPHVKTTVFDKKRIEKEKMGLLLAVNRGSDKEPVFIIVEYKGNPKSSEHTVIVGKGITYDTGGLNLKPTGSMETMKCDMGGAATALGTVWAAASAGLKVNLTAVVASTENSIGSKSYKPGDIYTSYSGKTVEIGNTDAEGRLILADALAYASQHLDPTRIIDFATLTGAVDIALGNENTGLMSNDDALADSLMQAGSNTFERVWRMPLHEEYKDQLKSDIADIKNVGGRPAGTITAALFLQEFVGKGRPWAHLDIASTAYLADAKRYHPKHATGIGIRLMMDFLEQL